MNVRQDVVDFLVENFYVPDTRAIEAGSLLDAGVVDSTGVLEVIAFLEERYGVRVDDHEMVPENLDSVERIVAFVERKRKPA